MRSEFFTYIEGEWTKPPGDHDSEHTLVVVFGGRGFLDQHRPFEELRAAYPTSQIVGCSTAGEIAGRSLHDDSLVVAVLQFERSRVRVASVTIEDDVDSETVGRSLAHQLVDDDLCGVFVLSNGLRVNGSKLVAGMNASIAPDVVVTGGLAGDGEAFERTWVLLGGDVALNRTVAVGFYGDDLVLTHGSRGGWDRFGPERLVTHAAGSEVFELDGQPALELYKQYLGDHAGELPAAGLLFPLEIYDPGVPHRRLVRTILGVNEARQSLTFAGDIPEGSRAQLMKANFDRLVDGAEEAADTAQSACHGPEPVCFAISCVGRRLVLRQRTEDELEAVADQLPADTRVVGFYSYGELSPHVHGVPCDLHNQTMTLTMISERAADSATVPADV